MTEHDQHAAAYPPAPHVPPQRVDEAVLRELLRTRLPAGLALLRDAPLVSVDSDGTDNTIHRPGESHWLRQPRVQWAVQPIRKEQRWLPWLAPHLPIAIPRVVFAGTPQSAYPCPWTLHDWMRGTSLTPDACTRIGAAALRGVAMELAGVDDMAGAP